MEFKNAKEALEYLRSLNTIVMPVQFTYFNHCTSFQAEAIQATQVLKKSWTQIPTEDFVIRREMSFVERTERIEEALDYGRVDEAAICYAMPKGAKPFIIRVIMPKKHLSIDDRRKLDIDEVYYQKLWKEYLGLRGGRHPRLGHGEHIFMFASSTKDEVSGQSVDILYGVREQDIIRYANAVREALIIQHTYLECIIPSPTRVSGQAYYEWDHNYQFERETYVIPRDKDFGRYERKDVGDNCSYQFSDFCFCRFYLRIYTVNADAKLS